MATSKLSVFLCLLAMFAVHFAQSASHSHKGATPAAAPAPSVDCSSLVMNMADCLSFVSNDSTAKKPQGSCCSGLKTVLKTDPQCLCEAFKSSATLGVVLNVTKALSLPAACKMDTSSTPKCGLSLSPSGAPAMAPGSSLPASSPTSSAMSPTMGFGPNAMAPGPASSGSSMLAVSIASLILGLVAVVAPVSSF